MVPGSEIKVVDLMKSSVWHQIRSTIASGRFPVSSSFLLTIAVSLVSRQLVIVRCRNGLWEYKFRIGTMILGRPKLNVDPVHPDGDRELTDLFFLNYTPQAGDLVVDVGAGVGSEIFALRKLVGPTGSVFGFEAHPVTFAILRRLCELNGWSNVDLIQAAVIDQRRRVFISDDEEHQANNIFGPGLYEVEGTTLDDFVHEREISHIDYLKMNIEGAERLAIAGMDHVADITDHICISCHDFLSELSGA